MDSYDKQILDIIQTGFPIAPRPYQVLGEAVGVSEQEAFDRVEAMKDTGLIRRMGANFQSKKLGFFSTLCAATVPDDKMDEFVAEVNRHPGVTHNYLRANDFNIWFTFIGPSWDAVCETLDAITAKTGIKILNLPAKKLFKIKVDFKMQESADA